MAYVYKHTRLDNNEIFYIGIGSDDTFSRAHSVKGRNSIWYRIIKITDFKVDILFTELSWEEACLKEIELIKLYGRKSLKNGTLANLTGGGDGFNKPHSEETKLKIQKHFKDKSYEELYGLNAEIEKKKRGDGNKKTWDKLSVDERKERGKKSVDRMKEFYKNNRSKRYGKVATQQFKAILQYTKEGEFIREWDSTRSASLELGLTKSSISANLNNKSKTAHGFIWKFKII